MSQPRRVLVLAALAVCGLGSGGCTVVKPVIGAIAGPAIMLGSSNGNVGGCGCDGQAIVAVLAVAAAVGAGAGLVTGIISDVRYVCGYCDDPTLNWADPFKINDE